MQHSHSQTPIYFQTRRETDWDIPHIHLPHVTSHMEMRAELAKELMMRGVITKEEWFKRVADAGFYPTVPRPTEGFDF